MPNLASTSVLDGSNWLYNSGLTYQPNPNTDDEMNEREQMQLPPLTRRYASPNVD